MFATLFLAAMLSVSFHVSSALKQCSPRERYPAANNDTSCFPGLVVPDEVPSSLAGWWCNADSEYAFLGFSYDVTGCQSLDQLKEEFHDIRNRFGGRYVRMYGACDNSDFYENVIEAAWEAGVGIHALIWFGFDDSNAWEQRRNATFDTFHSHPKAPFVIRALQFGSEPLFDGVLHSDFAKLAKEIIDAKEALSDLGIPVTISELVWGYQSNMNNHAQDVLDAIDIIDAHILPFFAQDASTADKSWPFIENDYSWLLDHSQGKKIYFSQTGWPWDTTDGVDSNSKDAVADVYNSKAYFELLDSQCFWFKQKSVGWFAHLYSEAQGGVYGIYGAEGKLKFDFDPRSTC